MSPEATRRLTALICELSYQNRCQVHAIYNETFGTPSAYGNKIDDTWVEIHKLLLENENGAGHDQKLPNNG